MESEKQKLKTELVNAIVYFTSIELEAEKEKDKLLSQLKELKADMSMEETTNELCNSKSNKISFSDN